MRAHTGISFSNQVSWPATTGNPVSKRAVDEHYGPAMREFDIEHEAISAALGSGQRTSIRSPVCYPALTILEHPRPQRHAHAGRAVSFHIELRITARDPTRRNGMARRSTPRKVTYFEALLPHLARNAITESTFEVGRRFRCTMRINCGELDPGLMIRPVRGDWHRAPRRRGAGRLAGRPQRRLSARRLDHRRAPRGRRRVSRQIMPSALPPLGVQIFKQAPEKADAAEASGSPGVRGTGGRAAGSQADGMSNFSQVIFQMFRSLAAGWFKRR